MTSLWHRITSTTQRAAERGALVSLPTEVTVIEDRGIPFLVHVSDLQDSKARASAEQNAHPRNPFLPPDPELFIGEIAPRHLSVLNKFNVLDHHLLIVTREYEPQGSLVNRDDIAALVRCMGEIDGLGFYNGGTVAGASESHKHLQLVPLPLGDGPLPTPLDAVIGTPGPLGTVCTLDPLPFAHALIPLDGNALTAARADELAGHFRAACRAVGVRDGSQPYNMLLTRRWLLVVPRSREFWHRVSVNALGFAGSLLVRNRSELDDLRATGPVAALRSVVEVSPC